LVVSIEVAVVAVYSVVKQLSEYADTQKDFANKIKRVHACADARGHHFQHF
jgi:hypothetical protein